MREGSGEADGTGYKASKARPMLDPAPFRPGGDLAAEAAVAFGSLVL